MQGGRLRLSGLQLLYVRRERIEYLWTDEARSVAQRSESCKYATVQSKAKANKVDIEVTPMKFTFTIVAIASLFAGFAIQMWLEAQHKVDSLGFWYTALCATMYAAVITAVFWGAAFLISRINKKN
jgi:hypothetical protein